MAEEDQQQPKIHIDSDWKAQAQAEKERLAEQARQRARKQQPVGGEEAPGTGAGGQGMPPANFETLVSTTATQALFAMGAIADPRSGQRFQNLDLARHHIDMLGVLEEKTQGNLTEEEEQMLATTLYELRTRYVQLASAGRSGG
ncbi:MAG: DUF1844 domain-containing protein [Phycisphaeraceae bacterium]